MQHTIITTDEATTHHVAQKLAQHCQSGDVILLTGPLGAGKSCFARGFIQSFYEQPVEVTSPTFTIIQTYETPQCEIWHCDLYRIESVEDFLELGLEDAFEEAITLIEWPKIMGGMLPENRLDISIDYGEEHGTRSIIVSPHGRFTKIDLS